MKWPFSAARWSPGSNWTGTDRQVLSQGTGNAQGGIDAVGSEIWATWQENGNLRNGTFETHIFAAPVSTNGQQREPIRLWQGRSIGPGSTQAVKFRDRIAFLYMRSGKHGKGLQTVVKLVDPKAAAGA